MIRYHYNLSLFTTALAALLVSACAPTSPVQTNNTTPLSDSQQSAVNTVAARLMGTASALNAGLPALDQDDQGSAQAIGECPAVTLTLNDGAVTFALDYGDGCKNARHGDSVLRGSLFVSAAAGGQAFTMAFDDLSIDDQSIDGSIMLVPRQEDGAPSLFAAIDIATAQSGAASGTMNFQRGTNPGEVIVTDATLSLSNADDQTYDVTANDVAFDPVGNGNLVPEAGSVAFTMANDGPGPETITVVVSFDAQSPVDGTVDVTIGDAPPTTHQLPGFDS